MTRKQWTWTIAAGAQLALAVVGALQFSLTDGPLPLRLLAQYGDVSGCDANYAFFAPAVASQCRARTRLRDASGREWEEPLLDDPSSVYGLRASSIFDSFPMFREPLRRAIAASWASVQFGRHARATQVTVSVEIESLPTMAEWRGGKRRSWTSIYEGEFERKEAPREQTRSS
jgi:hypothetical protein